MKNININQGIRILSTISRCALIIATAVLLGKICWWLAKPLGYDTVTHEVVGGLNVKSPASISASIVNRVPFGVVTIEEVVQPTIGEQVKVVGIYAAGPANSIAFLQINGKNSIAMVGDNVLNAKLSSISPKGIVVNIESQDVEINLTSAVAGMTDSVANQNRPTTNNSNNSSSYIPSPVSDTQNPNSAQNNDVADRRRKMIEAFQKQNTKQ